MTATINTTTANQTAITGYVSDSYGNTKERTYLCKMDGVEVTTAERVVYAITTTVYGDTPSDPTEHETFEDAWDQFVELFNEADDTTAEDLPETASEVERDVERFGEFCKSIGTVRRGGTDFTVSLRLAKTTADEELVDAPTYEDGDGREIAICYEEVSNQFVVQVKNLNGTFSICTLDGEVFSSARSWYLLDRVPESVRKEVEAVWDVEA